METKKNRTNGANVQARITGSTTSVDLSSIDPLPQVDNIEQKVLLNFEKKFIMNKNF